MGKYTPVTVIMGRAIGFAQFQRVSGSLQVSFFHYRWGGKAMIAAFPPGQNAQFMGTAGLTGTIGQCRSIRCLWHGW